MTPDPDLEDALKWAESVDGCRFADKAVGVIAAAVRKLREETATLQEVIRQRQLALVRAEAERDKLREENERPLYWSLWHID